MLAEAMEAEVAEFLAQHEERRDGAGHQPVVRNGHLPERNLITGIGPVRVKQPRVVAGASGGSKTDRRFGSLSDRRAHLPRDAKRFGRPRDRPAKRLKTLSRDDAAGEGGLCIGMVAKLLGIVHVIDLDGRSVFEAEGHPSVTAKKPLRSVASVQRGENVRQLRHMFRRDPAGRSTLVQRLQAAM